MARLSGGLLLFMSPLASAQGERPPRFWALSLAMGVNALSAPSVADYVNVVAQPGPNHKLDEFTSAIEFTVTPEVQILDEWSVFGEYALLVKSAAIEGAAGRSEFSHQTQLPLLGVLYLIGGEGYWLKLGGGLGYAVGEFSEALYGAERSTIYRARGPQLKLLVAGNTKFDDHFYGLIGVNIRWIFGGGYKTPGGREASLLPTRAEMNFFSLGLDLGIVFLQ